MTIDSGCPTGARDNRRAIPGDRDHAGDALAAGRKNPERKQR
jgi:hypothetical protein